MTQDQRTPIVRVLAGLFLIAAITGCTLKPTVYYIPAPTVPVPTVQIPTTVPVEEEPVVEPTATAVSTVLVTGTYSADDPGITYSSDDWTVTSDSAVSDVQNAMAMFQVNLPDPGAIVIRYRASADFGRLQIQLDDGPPESPIDLGAASMEPSLYWVSSTLEPGKHTVFLSSLDDRPVNLLQIGVARVLDESIRLYDETNPGILKFGNWNMVRFPDITNGGSAVTSRPDSGAIVIVFEQTTGKPISIRLVASSTAGNAIIDLDGSILEMPYSSPSKTRINIIGLADVKPGRHVMKITGDGSGHIVRFDGFEFTRSAADSAPIDLSDKMPETIN